MNEFLLIFRNAPYGELAEVEISPEEHAEASKAWVGWMGALQASGNLVGGQPLHASGKRISKKKVITDGPYVEGAEIVSGYVIVKATDIDHAIELAKDCPIYDYHNGHTEVRQISSLEG